MRLSWNEIRAGRLDSPASEPTRHMKRGVTQSVDNEFSQIVGVRCRTSNLRTEELHESRLD